MYRPILKTLAWSAGVVLGHYIGSGTEYYAVALCGGILLGIWLTGAIDVPERNPPESGTPEPALETPTPPSPVPAAWSPRAASDARSQ
jgi:hypothetical protein